MSRELKFRVWSYLSKSFVYFDIYQGANLGIAGGVSEPQQFTGLKDKNGKEIYEEDIVKFYPWNPPNKQLEQYLCNGLKQIKYGLGLDVGQYSSVGFVAINLQPADLEDGHQLNWMDARNIEIIGNIFEK